MNTIIHTDFSNYNNTDFQNFLKQKGNNVIQLLAGESLWTDEKQQRLLTVEEWEKAKKAWECLNELDIIKTINKFDLVWNTQNENTVIDTLRHYAPIGILDREFHDDCIDFYYKYEDVELLCTIYPDTITVIKSDVDVMSMSTNVNIAVNGKGLDYEYENIDISADNLIVVYN